MRMYFINVYNSQKTCTNVKVLKCSKSYIYINNHSWPYIYIIFAERNRINVTSFLLVSGSRFRFNLWQAQ